MFGQTTKADLPIEGDIQISQSLYPAAEEALIAYSADLAILSASAFDSLPSSRSVTSPCCQMSVLPASRAVF